MQSIRERLEQKRKGRRLRLLRMLAVVTAIFAVSFGIWSYVTSLDFSFGSIAIEGTNKVTEDDILKMSDAQKPVNLLLLSKSKIEEKLINDVRFEKADVSYAWPGIMKVKVKERIPAVYVASSYGSFLQLDYSGNVLMVSDGIRSADAPFLSGAVADNVFVGDKVKEQGILQTVTFLGKLDRAIIDKISEVNIKDDNVKIIFQYGYYIMIGAADKLSEKQKLFLTVYNELKNSELDVEYIDLTYEKPYIKLRK